MRNAGGMTRRKKRPDDGDLDITPMIDVTFLLLIFFMVTSTLQGTPDRDIPPAKSGESANAGSFTDLTIYNPATALEDSRIVLGESDVNLEELSTRVSEMAAGGPVKLMIYAERDVRNGFIGEVETVLREVEGDVDYKFAVREMH